MFTHVVPGLFTSAVSIFSGGSSFRWIRDAVLGGEPAAGYDAMTELAASSPVGRQRLLFNPSLAGGSSQEPSPNIRGAFAGSTCGTRAPTWCGPAMEGIALNLGAVLAVLRRFVPLAPEMLMVGGREPQPAVAADLRGRLRHGLREDEHRPGRGLAGRGGRGGGGRGLWRDFGKVDEAHRVEDVAGPIPANVEKYRRLMPAFELLRRQQAELGELLHGIDLELKEETE